MSALHDWHRSTFTKSHDTVLEFPPMQTQFGGTLPAQTRNVRLKSARAVVCQRAVNAMTPEQWADAQDAFDASDEGHALASTDPSVRREHCELWLLKSLFEAEHADLVAPTELALNSLLEVHATTGKVHAHRDRLLGMVNP